MLQTAVCVCHVIDTYTLLILLFYVLAGCASVATFCGLVIGDFVTPPKLNCCWPHCMTWRILRFSSRKRAASASASLIVTGVTSKGAVPSSKLDAVPSSKLDASGGVPVPSPATFSSALSGSSLPTPPSDGVCLSSHAVAKISRHFFVPAGPTV